MPTYQEVVREYFPGASDGKVENILWEHTGFPCFWEKYGYSLEGRLVNNASPEICLRKQLQELKDKVNA